MKKQITLTKEQIEVLVAEDLKELTVAYEAEKSELEKKFNADKGKLQEKYLKPIEIEVGEPKGKKGTKKRGTFNEEKFIQLYNEGKKELKDIANEIGIHLQTAKLKVKKLSDEKKIKAKK